MDYRIVEVLENGETQYFTPQRKILWMFWSWTTTYPGYDHSILSYRTRKDAIEYIEHDIKCRNIKRTKKAHNYGN